MEAVKVMNKSTKGKEYEQKEQRECLNRMKRAINIRIQDNVFPNWKCHNSLKGWSSMNYPPILSNIKRLVGRRHPSLDNEKLKATRLIHPVNLSTTHRIRPISLYKELKAERLFADPINTESFLSKITQSHGIEALKEHKEIIKENRRYKCNDIYSAKMISTSAYEEKKNVIEKLNKIAETHSTVKPISIILGHNINPLKNRKVKQLNDIQLDNEESEEDEATYEFKVSLLKLVETS